VLILFEIVQSPADPLSDVLSMLEDESLAQLFKALSFARDDPAALLEVQYKVRRVIPSGVERSAVALAIARNSAHARLVI